MSGFDEKSAVERPLSKVSSWRGLLDTAAQFGTYCWVSLRLFEVLGAWIHEETDPELKLILDAHAREHAWHSSLWFERIPELADLDAAALVVSPTPQFSALVQSLEARPRRLDRLAVMYLAMVPHVADRCRHELTILDEVSGASARRWIRFMLVDLDGQVSWGGPMVDSLIDSPAEARRIQDVIDEFRSAIGSAEGAPGPPG